MIRAWSIPGADDQTILGDTHSPDGRGGVIAANAVIIIAHGFKGYKDYGMFPRLAQSFAAAGLIAHRFNFSHSGMTNNLATFERPDLFERDTWRMQVFDLRAVMAAITRGEIAGAGLPLFVLGHSRGGVTAILTAGDTAGDLTYLNQGLNRPSESAERRSSIAGVITLASPATCNPLTTEQRRELLEQGWLESPSSRTGQLLRIGRAFLQEQLDDPAGHDVLAHVARIQSPMLVMHGDADATVPPEQAHQIAQATDGRADLRVIAGGDHVFNTTNPLADDQPASAQLQRVIDKTLAFIAQVTSPAS